MDFEFDARDILYVRIDRRRKMPATILLKAFGFSSDDLLKMYYPVEEVRLVKESLCESLTLRFIMGCDVRSRLTEKGSKDPWSAKAPS